MCGFVSSRNVRMASSTDKYQLHASKCVVAVVAIVSCKTATVPPHVTIEVSSTVEVSCTLAFIAAVSYNDSRLDPGMACFTCLHGMFEAWLYAP